MGPQNLFLKSFAESLKALQCEPLQMQPRSHMDVALRVSSSACDDALHSACLLLLLILLCWWLVWHSGVWALGIALRRVPVRPLVLFDTVMSNGIGADLHLTTWAVLLRAAVHLLSLILTTWLTSMSITDGRELWALTSHLMGHHAWLTVLAGRALRLRAILPITSSFLSLALFFLLARILFFLLLELPFCEQLA